jgi:small subunit ribosomal protein S16
LAVKLRLRRMGKKKQPIYKVVAADSRSPRDGKFLEAVGIYNPLTKPHTVDLKEERVNYWLDKGAQPTDTVKSLLSQKGINLKRDIAKRKLSDEKADALLKSWQTLKEAAAQKNTVKKKKKSKQEEAKS